MDGVTPGIGHNQPTDPLLAEAAERIENANRWLTERGDWEKWDAETADKANFFIDQIGATHKALDGRRLQEGRDFKAAQDKVYNAPLGMLVIAKDKLVPLRRKWLQREDDRVQEARRKAEAEAEAKRKAAEEAARLAAKSKNPIEAELAAARAQDEADEAEKRLEAAPEKARIKGTYTTTAKGLSDYWLAEITDLSAAFRHFNKKGNPHKATLEAAIRDAIEGIAQREAKRLKTENPADFPPGIAFKKERR